MPEHTGLDLVGDGSFFSPSQNATQFYIDYATWKRHMVHSAVWQPSDHWHDAGFFSKHMATLAKDTTGWQFLVGTLIERVRVPRFRKACTSFKEVLARLKPGSGTYTGLADDPSVCGDIADCLDAAGYKWLPWAEVGKPVPHLASSLQAKIEQWWTSEDPVALMEHDPDVDRTALSSFLQDVARPAFQRAVERGAKEAMPGVTVSDIIAELAVGLGVDGGERIDAQSLVNGRLEADARRPLAWSFCHKVAELYDENFAEGTGLRRYSVNVGWRTVVLRETRPSRDPSSAVADDGVPQQAVLCDIRLPSVESICQMGAASLAAARKAHSHYFMRLAAWRKDPSSDLAQNKLIGALKEYAEELCQRARPVDDSFLSRCRAEFVPMYGGMVAGYLIDHSAIGAIAGGFLGAHIPFVIRQLDESLQVNERRYTVKADIWPARRAS